MHIYIIVIHVHVNAHIVIHVHVNAHIVIYNYTSHKNNCRAK